MVTPSSRLTFTILAALLGIFLCSGRADDDPDSDLDGDGLTAAVEWQLGTDPNNLDSDGDGMRDGWEVTYGFNPLVDDGQASLDPDGDNSTNAQESTAASNPFIWDTDDDGLGDGEDSSPLNAAAGGVFTMRVPLEYAGHGFTISVSGSDPKTGYWVSDSHTLSGLIDWNTRQAIYSTPLRPLRYFDYGVEDTTIQVSASFQAG